MIIKRKINDQEVTITLTEEELMYAEKEYKKLLIKQKLIKQAKDIDLKYLDSSDFEKYPELLECAYAVYHQFADNNDDNYSIKHALIFIDNHMTDSGILMEISAFAKTMNSDLEWAWLKLAFMALDKNTIMTENQLAGKTKLENIIEELKAC